MPRAGASPLRLLAPHVFLVSPPAAHTHTPQHSPPVHSRLHRLKLIILGSGELAVARCHHELPTHDLALLIILSRSGAHQFSHVSVAAADPKRGAKAICVGNPSEFDLEKGGTIKFQPPLFHTSAGAYKGESDPKRVAAIGACACCCCCCC